jgi:hypothetical protein
MKITHHPSAALVGVAFVTLACLIAVSIALVV